MINWYPGHMAKTKRLISENIRLIDIVYELVDARIPFSSKVPDLNEYIKGTPKIMIFTKYDLCDKKETEKWIKHYKNLGNHVISLDLSKNTSLKNLLDLTKKILEEKVDKRIEKGLKQRKTRALIVGVPNVGKSTLINRLAGKKTVEVGNKPGVTKTLSWIRTNSDIELLDTPGILWPRIADNAHNLATFTAIKEEVLPIEEVAVYVIKKLFELYPNILETKYTVKDISDMNKVFDVIGKKRGCLEKGGVVNVEKAHLVILNDIKLGGIKGVTFDRL